MNSRKSILVRGCTGGLFITVDDSIDSKELNDRVMERIRRVGPEIRGESIILEVDKRSMDSDALQSFQMRLNQEFGMSGSAADLQIGRDARGGKGAAHPLGSRLYHRARPAGGHGERSVHAAFGRVQTQPARQHTHFRRCESWRRGVRLRRCDRHGNALGRRHRRGRSATKRRSSSP